MYFRATAAASALLIFSTFTPASAHPVFADKYDMRCSGCHVTPISDGGRLNSNGRNFKRNGYKFPEWGGGGGNDDDDDDDGGLRPGCIKIGLITMCPQSN